MSQLTSPQATDPGALPPGTDVMAVLGLVFAFVVPPLGIVFSALGLRRTRRDGTRGRGMAVAGLVLSLVFVLGTVLILRAGAALS